MMQLAASETKGAFANSIADLAGQIGRDLEASYVLEVALTAADRDSGVPKVDVQVADASAKAVMVDLSPIEDEAEPMRRRAQIRAMWQATAQPVKSSEFQIVQHVDYFPVHGGWQPLMPMSAQVSRLGRSSQDVTIQIAEYVQNLALDTFVLEEDAEVDTPAGIVEWERDGKLSPGQYDWRIIVHSEDGHVLASADKRVLVGLPENKNVPVSTLIVGSQCIQNVRGTELRRRNESALEVQNQLVFGDPLWSQSCRVKPSAAGIFRQGQTAEALVRIYPAGQLQKDAIERWSAVFSLASPDGAIDTAIPGKFTADLGGGYVTTAKMPLLHSGSKHVSVTIQGPGLRRPLVEEREIFVVPVPER